MVDEKVREKAKKQTFTTADVQSVFYKIIHSKNGVFEEKRFLDPEDAKLAARHSHGQVVKMTKRIVETMEMELLR